MAGLVWPGKLCANEVRWEYYPPNDDFCSVLLICIHIRRTRRRVGRGGANINKGRPAIMAGVMNVPSPIVPRRYRAPLKDE